jgi:hypothetical protein
LNRIGIHSLLEREEDVDALLAWSAEIGLHIGRVGFLEAVKDSDDFLHELYFTARRQSWITGRSRS